MFLSGGTKISVFGGIDAKGTCYNDIRTIDLDVYLGKVSSGTRAPPWRSFKVLIIGILQ